MKAEFMTPRTKQQREACQLLCGRKRAPDNKFGLCQPCMDRVNDIEQDARRRRTAIPREPQPGCCSHGSCDVPVAAQSETAPCDRYCVAHCITHGATHKCRRTILRQARARYKARQRAAA